MRSMGGSVLFLQKRALGSLLYEKVCDHLDLLEKEYFGLTYKDDLDPNGTRVRLLYGLPEVTLTPPPSSFYFNFRNELTAPSLPFFKSVRL